jgi:hypothetical protein
MSHLCVKAVLQLTDGMILLVFRCPVPGAAAVVCTWPDEALAESVPHLCGLS